MPRDVPDVASWNVYRDNTEGVPGIKRGIDKLIDRGADVICLQELSNDDWWRQVKAWMEAKGWWVLDKNMAIATYVNAAKYDIRTWKNTVVFDPSKTGEIRVEKSGANSTLGYKSFTEVVVQRKDSPEDFTAILNNHIVPSIQNGAGELINPLRLKYAKAQVVAVGTRAKYYADQGLPVIVCADWNISSSTPGGAELRQWMAVYGLTSAQDTKGPFDTHGDREIDDQYSANVTIGTMWRIGTGDEKGYTKDGSDHNPIVVNYDPKDSAPSAPNEGTEPVVRSQNGWPARHREDIKLKKIVPKGAPDTALMMLDNADVLTVMQYVADELQLIEDWDLYTKGSGDDWGYADRLIRGSTSTTSNHGSGTAFDANATRHPLAVKPESTFTSKQIAAIRALIKRLRGVVRWGGDYSGRKDGMHYELNIGPSSSVLKQVAADIRSGKIKRTGDVVPKPAPAPAPAIRVKVSLKAIQAGLRSGSELVAGDDGAEYQKALNRFTGFDLVPDGVLGRNTRVVTAQAQLKVAQKNGAKLTIADCWPNPGYDSDLDGIVGGETLKALGLDNSDT